MSCGARRSICRSWRWLLAGGGRRAKWSDRRGRERQRTEAEGAQRSPQVAASMGCLAHLGGENRSDVSRAASAESRGQPGTADSQTGSTLSVIVIGLVAHEIDGGRSWPTPKRAVHLLV